jgi:hypothetical protein
VIVSTAMVVPLGERQLVAEAAGEAKPPGAGDPGDSEKPKIFGFQVSQ